MSNQISLLGMLLLFKLSPPVCAPVKIDLLIKWNNPHLSRSNYNQAGPSGTLKSGLWFAMPESYWWNWGNIREARVLDSCISWRHRTLLGIPADHMARLDILSCRCHAYLCYTHRWHSLLFSAMHGLSLEKRQGKYEITVTWDNIIKGKTPSGWLM